MQVFLQSSLSIYGWTYFPRSYILIGLHFVTFLSKICHIASSLMSARHKEKKYSLAISRKGIKQKIRCMTHSSNIRHQASSACYLCQVSGLSTLYPPHATVDQGPFWFSCFFSPQVKIQFSHSMS
jgi:hypothetical protein